MSRGLGLSWYKKSHLENVIGTAATYDTVLVWFQMEQEQKMVTTALAFLDLNEQQSRDNELRIFLRA